MAEVTVRALGLERVERELRQVVRRASNLEPVFRGPVDRLITSVLTRQFATEGAFGGQRWRPLSPATMRDKQRSRRGGMGILRRTNRLWASLIKSGGPESIRVIEPMRYVRGTRVPYAVYHQRGARLRQWGGRAFKRTRKLPARQLFPEPLPESVQRTVLALVRRYVGGS